MFKESVEKVALAGGGKADIVRKDWVRYFVASILAGVYVGIGILLIFSIGGMLTGESVYTKIIMGVSFGIALSLVIMAGAELFTGNNFIMTVAGLQKKAKWQDVAFVWLVSFLGNLAGSILIGFLFVQAGFVDKGAILSFFENTSIAKTSNSISNLFFAGILCNLLVCLAVWCSFKLESESGKLIMIWWCLFAFITCGFEHSVANMTIFSVGVFTGKITIGAMMYNLLWVTLGNMVGGIALGIIYHYISGKKKEKQHEKEDNLLS